MKSAVLLMFLSAELFFSPTERSEEARCYVSVTCLCPSVKALLSAASQYTASNVGAEM